MAPKAPVVVVVGSSNTDMTVACPKLPRTGETVTGGDFYVAAGGKGANQAVAAARARSEGTKVAFVGAVGDDRPGREALAGLKAEGIDCRRTRKVPGVPSGVALILVGPGGENLIAVAPGANARLSREDVSAARSTIRSASVLVVQLEVPLDAVAEALAVAHGAGAVTVLNPAPAPPAALPDSVLAATSILVPNETEFETMTGAPPESREGERAAKALASKVATALVVTEGSRGAVIYERSGGVRRVAAHKVEALDTVAAGDAFVGAMAVALAEGRDVALAVGFANAAAAVSVTRRGAQPSLPGREDILAMLAAGP